MQYSQSSETLNFDANIDSTKKLPFVVQDH
jgi:hypothetical protein